MMKELSQEKILLYVVTDVMQVKGKSNVQFGCKQNTAMSAVLVQNQLHL